MTDIEKPERETISFSEILTFDKCPYKWHWLYILGNKQPDNIHSIFGTAVHQAIEFKWKHNVQTSWITMLKILLVWGKIYGDDVSDFITAAKRIYQDFFPFIEEKFPGCELYDIEFKLAETLSISPKKFKGYIDLILFDRTKNIYHLIDLKTTKSGWFQDQMRDTKKLYQVILYKKFFCEKQNIDPKNVKCYYLLMKRSPAKKDKYCLQLVPVTSEKKKTENAFNWLTETAEKIEMKMKIKNPTTCQFCVCGASKKENIWKKKKQ